MVINEFLHILCNIIHNFLDNISQLWYNKRRRLLYIKMPRTYANQRFASCVSAIFYHNLSVIVKFAKSL